jgi:PhnB protein
VLMGCDAPPATFVKPQGFNVTFSCATPADAQRVFTELSQNGTVAMPFGPTFFSPGFGMLVDRFGIPWMVLAEAAVQGV